MLGDAAHPTGQVRTPQRLTCFNACHGVKASVARSEPGLRGYPLPCRLLVNNNPPRETIPPPFGPIGEDAPAPSATSANGERPYIVPAPVSLNEMLVKVYTNKPRTPALIRGARAQGEIIRLVHRVEACIIRCARHEKNQGAVVQEESPAGEPLIHMARHN